MSILNNLNFSHNEAMLDLQLMMQQATDVDFLMEELNSDIEFKAASEELQILQNVEAQYNAIVAKLEAGEVTTPEELAACNASFNMVTGFITSESQFTMDMETTKEGLLSKAKEKAGDIGKAVMAGINKVIEVLINFYKRWLTKLGRTEAGLENIIKLANKNSGKSPKATKLEVKEAILTVNEGKDFDLKTALTFAAGMSSVDPRKHFGDFTEYAKDNEYIEIYLNLMSYISESFDELKLSKTSSAGKDFGFSSSDIAGLDFYISTEMPGGYYVIVTVDGFGEKGKSYIRRKKSFPESVSIETDILPLSESVNIAEGGLKLINTIKKSQDDIDSFFSDLKKSLKQNSNLALTERIVIRLLTQSYSNFIKEQVSYSIKVVHGLYKLAYRNISMYTEDL